MKNGILKVLAVITAFLIGVTINNSCGNADSGGDMTLSQLQREIASLRAELNGLKAEVESLKSGGENGGGGNSDCGEFYVDGLYFNRNGHVASKMKSTTSSDSRSEYQHDNQGRITKSTHYSSGCTSTFQYSYSGKKVTSTLTAEYDPAIYPNLENRTTTTITEYY